MLKWVSQQEVLWPTAMCDGFNAALHTLPILVIPGHDTSGFLSLSSTVIYYPLILHALHVQPDIIIDCIEPPARLPSEKRYTRHL